MQLVVSPVSIASLRTIASSRFGNMVKGVVDIEKNLMMIDADMHADEEAALLDAGSNQKNLWGINLYPEFFGMPDFVEFDSMINLRPSSGNMSRGVDDVAIQQNIRKIVETLIVA